MDEGHPRNRQIGTLSDGSAVVKLGNTMLFASVVSNKEPKEGRLSSPFL